MTWKEDVNLAKFYLQPSRSQTWLSQILGCAGAFLIHRWETIELHLQVSGDVFVAWFHWPNSWHPDHLVSLGTPWFSMVFHIFSQKATMSWHAWHDATRCFCLRFFEIYNEIIFDLLNPVSDRSKLGGGLQIKEHPVMGIYVKDLTVPELSIGHLSFQSLWWYDPLVSGGSDLHPLPWCQDVPSCAKLCQVLRKSPPVAIRRSWRRMWPRWRPCWRMATRAGPCPRRSWTPPVPGRGRSAERVEQWG